MGIILHLTGAAFDNDLAVLRSYFRMGVRSAHPFADDPALAAALIRWESR